MPLPLHPDDAVLRDWRDCVKGRLPADPDWEAIMALANRTMTTPAIAAALLAREGLPEDVRGFLAVIRDRTRERSAAMHAQLSEAVETLAEAGIAPLLIKGSALLAASGAELHRRIAIDLDIMVRGDSFALARDRLVAAGYRAECERSEPASLCTLVRDNHAAPIDLHGGLKLRHPRIGHAELAGEARRVRCGGADALLPSPTAQAAVLILHDQLQEGDYWRGLVDLRHLLDLLEIERLQGPIDWQAMERFFPPGWPERAMRVQAASYADFLRPPHEPPLPDGMRARLQAHRRRRRAAGRVRAWLATALALLLDPPARPVTFASAPGRARAGALERVKSTRRFLVGLFREAKPQKV